MADYLLATFTADVTPPIGHPCMGGGILPVQGMDDPLFARGLVIYGACDPIVWTAIDWCEIRNDAFERWRQALAEAAHTVPQRVIFSCVHQHDAPIADLTAQRMLDESHAQGKICDLEFHEQAVKRVANALKESYKSGRKFSRIGTGQAKVEKVTSNRRFVRRDGTVSFDRTSSTKDPEAHEAPEGLIDPWLKTLSFWDDETALAAVSCYSTHPMSYYGKGGVSADFVGLARSRRQADDPSIFQIYCSGCSGNTTAGKYNDGSPENRPALADRIYQGMLAAWKETKTQPIVKIDLRVTPLNLQPRDGEGFTPDDLKKKLQSGPRPFDQCLAAFGLSWRKRLKTNPTIDIPAIDFGPAQVILLPGETYVEFQLAAQKVRPDSFVMAIGYGECATGYIPTDKHFEEKDGNLRDWCWVAPGSEARMLQFITSTLTRT